MFENTQLALPRLNVGGKEVEGRKLHGVVSRWRAYRSEGRRRRLQPPAYFALLNKLLVQLNRANRY